jgi:hypothetical protein
MYAQGLSPDAAVDGTNWFSGSWPTDTVSSRREQEWEMLGPAGHRTCRRLLAELGDEDLHHLPSGLRHLGAPEIVDEPVHRDDAVRVELQQGEQRLLLTSRQPDGAVVGDDLERPEYVKIDQLVGSPPSIIYACRAVSAGAVARSSTCNATEGRAPSL